MYASIMHVDPWTVLLLGVALGSGLIGGVFFAFSSFVMRALRSLPAAQGIAGMQAINVKVINPIFLGVFLGTAGGATALAVGALTGHAPGQPPLLLAGAVLYVGGTFLVTMVCNVPRNNALAAVDPHSSDGARLWADYVVTWTRWNHVRTTAAALALIAFAAAADSTPP